MYESAVSKPIWMNYGMDFVDEGNKRKLFINRTQVKQEEMLNGVFQLKVLHENIKE